MFTKQAVNYILQIRYLTIYHYYRHRSIITFSILKNELFAKKRLKAVLTDKTFYSPEKLP